MTTVMLGVALTGAALVLIPRWVSAWRWTTTARSATTYLLKPTGKRPDDLDEAAAAVDSVINALGSKRGAGITLHRWRDTHEVVTAATVHGHPDPDRIASMLAGAVGADPVVHDDEVPSPGQVWYSRRFDYNGRDPNDREQPPLTETGKWLNDVLARADADDGLVVSVGLEPVRRWEARELRRWHETRSTRNDEGEGTGPGHAARARVLVFSDDPDLAEQVAAGLPSQTHRWPFTIKGRLATSLRTWGALAAWFVVPTVLLASVAAVRAAFATVDQPEPGPLAALTGDASGSVLLVASVLLTVLAALSWRTPWGFPNREQQTAGRLHLDGVVAVERPWLLSPVRWLRNTVALVNPMDQNAVREDHQRSFAYPYRVSTLVMNTQQVAQVAAFPPQSETAATRTEAVRISAPPDVTRFASVAGLLAGSPIGTDHVGGPVALPDRDRKSGFFVTGDPGSGKTGLVHRVFRSDAAARLAGRRNGQMAMLWFETKGDGLPTAEAALRAEGYGPLAHPNGWVPLHANATDGPRLDLVDRTDPSGSASRLVGAFTYAFETGAIGPRAAEAMRAAFQLVLTMDPTTAEAAFPHSGGALNVLHVAALLMYQRGYAPKDQLLEVIEMAAHQQVRSHLGQQPSLSGGESRLSDLLTRADKDDPDGVTGIGAQLADQLEAMPSTGAPLYDAYREWMKYELNISRRVWSEMFESPRNKLTALAQVGPLWTPAPGRPSVTFRELLDHNAVGLVNFGTSPFGAVDGLTSERLAAVALYLLWEDIKRTCSGWLDQGRSVGVYADELSHLSGTGSGDDVVGEMFDKGRSFGVQLTLATQRYDQLPQRTASAAMSFGTRVYMRLEGIETAKLAVEDLNRADPDGPFTVRDVSEFPDFTGAIRMMCDGAPQSPFTMRVNDPLPESRGHDTGPAALAAHEVPGLPAPTVGMHR